jgi:hypothetical protein
MIKKCTRLAPAQAASIAQSAAWREGTCGLS